MTDPMEESSTEAKVQKHLEDLEDALELAIAAAGKIHITLPEVFNSVVAFGSSSMRGYPESVADLLRRARGPIRERLNALYAAEYRKNRVKP